MSLPPVVSEAPAAILPQARAIGLPSAVSADLLQPPRRLYHASMLALVGLVAGFFIWSAQAAMTEFTVGQGKVIPARKVQVVQNLEGGIVRAIAVREGQQVKQGDLLLSIDPTAPGAQLAEAREKTAGLMALMARLDAELKGSKPQFPPEVAARRPDLVANELALFESRRREIESALSGLDLQIRQREQEVIETKAKIASLQSGLALAKREFELVQPLVLSGAAARIEGIRAESKVVEIDGALRSAELAIPRIEAALAEARDRRIEKEQSYRGEALMKLSQADNELAGLMQGMRNNEDRVRRTDMTAPVNGIVKSLHVTTIGQVIQPGSSAVEIVPIDETLLVEAQVRPQDIAFLRPGLDAMVKLSAYDATIYGGLPARLEHIGADSITSDKGETYYIIRVRTDANSLHYKGRELPIIPGMVADVEIKTGQKTVLQYLIKPITRMQQQALRER
ncbi:MAG: HlyD family type I secretion periplasmic adaptor subunit [Methylocystis sp.]|nr:HlyD family type I secretion periplasmic adaptor subunit [Methylocystis sp.]MCA3584364.1 HlyD family type I secretion periplasmic adaptor subunit [Methylocystis sp.]MCA3589740.1 HlyD family type I secretion periplasmic adaptor subunit [Methylocystis sp.]MCA3592615.1 HlyD family type I secretion periplasmic adaptor subunit [Methylocystis sp.]